ncbi:MAG: modulator of drug activity B [Clostridium sp.]|jgi:modulator of drug activity B
METKIKKALVINAYETYQGIGEGRLNKSLCEIAQETLENKGYQVNTTILEEGYRIEEELEKNANADLIFIQFPVYWFNVPAIYKKYMDEVYGYAYANGLLCNGDGRTRSDLNKKYGSGGLQHDAKYMISTAWNAPLEAFQESEQFFETKSSDDVLIGVHKTYQFLGMKALPSFGIYNIFKEDNLDDDVALFREHVKNVF